MPPENDPAIPANRLGRLGWVAKWLGLLLCAVLAAGFLWSTRRATGWTSPQLRFQDNLAIGTVNFGWRPDGWKLEDDKYPSTPGWSGVAEYGGTPGLLWWPSVSRVGKAWEGVEIPIWIPFLLVFAPTFFMWHRDRARTVSYAQRVLVWLRPRYRRRVTIRLVLLFTVLHVLGVTQGFWLNFQLGQFFFPGRPSRYGLVAERILTFTAPLWGWLYAWVWVRVRNGLLARNPGMTCASCGYDLTGNISGVCPECGVAVTPPL